MKFAHLKAFAVAMAVSTAMAGTANAQVVGGSSDSTKANIGASTVNGGPHVAGRPGIGVPSTGLTTRIDFQGLQGVLGADANGVTTFTAVTGTVTDHSQYGRFDFAKVGTQNVYFGEWTQTGSVTAGDHTVYYAGTGASSAVPQSGSATYAVKGISDYANKGILTGTFTADFGNQEVTGFVQSAGGYKVDIGSADIIGATISGNGAVASQTGVGNLATGGAVSGRFFGSNVEALAGIVKFGNGTTSVRQYDTAFGGTKN